MNRINKCMNRVPLIQLSIIIVLHIVFQTCKGGNCPSSATNSLKIETQQFGFSGTTQSSYGVKAGPISNSLYYLFKIDSSNSTIMKVNSNNVNVWINSFSFGPTIKSLAVDPTEQSIYFGKWDIPFYICILNATSGSFISAQQFQNVNCSDNSMSTHILSDGSGYYIIGQDSNLMPYLCKYLFTALISAQCQEISIFNGFAYGQLKVTDSQFFLTGYEPAPNFHLKIIKITFGNTAVDWGNKIICTGGTCTSGYSEVIINSANQNNSVYTIIPYGSPRNLYFMHINLVDGSVIGSVYASSSSCSDVYGIAQIDNKILASLDCGTLKSLLICNTDIFQFEIKQFSGSSLVQIVKEPSNFRLVILGDYNLSLYISKFVIESIEVHQEFSAYSAMQFNSQASSSVIKESGITISSINAENVVQDMGNLNTLATYSQSATPYTSDVYFMTSKQSYLTIVENTYIEYFPDLPCSSSGSTSITFSLAGYNGGSVPTWLAIDATLGTLKITAPNVTAASDYLFYINSQLSGFANPVQKQINIRVNKCTVTNCSKCTSSSSSTCATCASGFSEYYGNCYNQNCIYKAQGTLTNLCSKSSDTANSASIAIISSVGVTILAVLVSSFLSNSSLASIWLMINQLQIFFILLLTRSYFPKDVIDIIIGSKIFQFPFDFIPFKDINISGYILGPFQNDQTNEMMNKIGVKSISTIVNLYSFACSLFLAIFLNSILEKQNIQGRCEKFIKFLKWITIKTFSALTYGYYIRSLIEVFQYISLSCVQEISGFYIYSAPQIVSLVLSILIIISLISFVIFCIGFVISTEQKASTEHSKFEEILSGLKHTRICKFYSVLFLIRRIFFVIVIVALSSINIFFVILILSIYQCLHMIYIIVSRPFEEIKNNVVEILNELYFVLLLIWLFYFYTNDRWTDAPTYVYIALICSNNFAIFLIVIVSTIIDLIKKCGRCARSTQVDIKEPSKDEQPKSVNQESNNKLNANKQSKESNKRIFEESKIEFEENKSNIQMIKLPHPKNTEISSL